MGDEIECLKIVENNLRNILDILVGLTGLTGLSSLIERRGLNVLRQRIN